MQISVKMVDRTFNLNVNAGDTVHSVKHRIQKQEGILVGRQRIIFNGEQLSDDSSLVDYDIDEESTIDLLLRPTPLQHSCTPHPEGSPHDKVRVNARCMSSSYCSIE